MAQPSISEEELYGFLFDHIDTVPHLEALLQLWDSRPKVWSVSELARRLYVDEPTAHSILSDLVRQNLVVVRSAEAREFEYHSFPENDRMIDALARAYRTDLVRISSALHYKASSGVREFARAFQFFRKGKKP